MAKNSGRHSPERDGQLLPQAAHIAHILFAAKGVNHAAGGQEESALKNAWVTRWKIPAE